MVASWLDISGATTITSGSYFHEDKMFWNCECDFWAEDICLEPSTPDSAPCFAKASMSLGLTTLVPRFDLYTLGYHIFHYNEKREFTNEGDAVDAFRGIMNRIERVTGIEFHWGLPCKQFHHALLWGDAYSHDYRSDRRRSAPCRIFDANGNSHLTKIPSWSWLGWYTRCYEFSDPGENSKHLDRFFESTNTDWAAKWFRIDLQGNVFEIATHNEDFRSPLLGRPEWAEAPISSGVSLADVASDYSRIVALTSFNKLRILTSYVEIGYQENNIKSTSSRTFNLLDENSQIIGWLNPRDLLFKEGDDDLVSEFEAYDSVHDFIVISRERHAVFAGDDENRFEYFLNLMSIEWSSKDSTVASRQSLFRIEEETWIACGPQWRQVILE